MTPNAEAQSYSPSDLNVRQQREYFDREYDADYNLLNGISYIDLYSPSLGHPYYGENSYRTGSIVINGTDYPVVQLKYDIYNQQIQLYDVLPSGKTSQIILRNEFIEAFGLDGKVFQKLYFAETGERYFQVLEAGKITCLYYTGKKMSENLTSTDVNYVFGDQKREAYLLIDGTLHPYRYARSFTKIFPGEQQRDIRRYIRKNRLLLNKITDRQMKRLLDYCYSVSGGGQ